jgi:uncharacterized membrane protein YkvA (DUF1232 family)
MTCSRTKPSKKGRRPTKRRLRELAAFFPDCIVLTRRLLGDPRVPRRAKAALALLLPYLASPIDFIPDFIPIVGQLDDVLLVALALRYVLKLAGPQVVEDHWPGSPGGLAVVLQLAA